MSWWLALGGGGAILGLALSRKGIDTVVVEQASGPPSRGARRDSATKRAAGT